LRLLPWVGGARAGVLNWRGLGKGLHGELGDPGFGGLGVGGRKGGWASLLDRKMDTREPMGTVGEWGGEKMRKKTKGRKTLDALGQ